MRVVIVFLLLLANATVLLWQYYRPPASHRPAPTSTDVPELRLAASRPAVPEQRHDRRSTGDHQVATQPVVPAERAGSAAAPAVTQPISTGGSESAVSRPEAPSLPASGSAASKSEGETVCLAVGPFADRNATGPARKLLDGWGRSTHVESQDIIQQRFWVYLPPLPSAQAARREVAALKARGIVDLQQLGSDQMENAISLGLFKDHDIAERRMEQIHALGYTPKMDTISQSVTVYWLVAERPTVPLSDDHRRTLLAAQSGLRLQSRPCP